MAQYAIAGDSALEVQNTMEHTILGLSQYLHSGSDILHSISHVRYGSLKLRDGREATNTLCSSC